MMLCRKAMRMGYAVVLEAGEKYFPDLLRSLDMDKCNTLATPCVKSSNVDGKQ